MSIENNITLLYNGLQNILQESYRNTLKPLSESDFHIWFDKDKLNKSYGFACYLKYLYQEDIYVSIEPEIRFVEVSVVPWTWKKEWDEKHIGYYTKKEHEGSMIGVYSMDSRYEKPFVYPICEFNKIGLYCDYDSEIFNAYTPNPIIEVKKWKNSYGK